MKNEKIFLVEDYTEIREVSYVKDGANRIEIDIMKSQEKGVDSMSKKDANQEMSGSQKIEVVADATGQPVIANPVVDMTAAAAAAAGVTVSDDETAKLNKEREALLAEVEQTSKENEALKFIPESVPVDPNVSALANEATKLEIETLKLKIENLKKEKEQLLAGRGIAKGFTREFRAEMPDEDSAEAELVKKLAEPDATIATATNILVESLKQSSQFIN